MGFVRHPHYWVMTFDGPLTGLEIGVRILSGTGHVELDSRDATPESPLSAVDLFVGQVHSWNLEYPDGRAVPVNFEAFMAHDKEFIKLITGAWIRDVVPMPYPHQPPAPAAAPVEREPDLSHLAELAELQAAEPVEAEPVAAAV